MLYSCFYCLQYGDVVDFILCNWPLQTYGNVLDAVLCWWPIFACSTVCDVAILCSGGS